MSIALSEQIATLALDTFSNLPTRCKPRTLPEGRTEWTPMSAIVLCHSTEARNVVNDGMTGSIKIVSLATGTKSLPVSALSKCNGLVLHDCHAEILALRGFNYWLLTEMQRLLASTSYISEWLEFKPLSDEGYASPHDEATPLFRLRKGVEISLFSTEAPCGDASMEVLMAATEASGRDITPWPIATVRQTGDDAKLPPGRGSFSDLGSLRRKPARADAEISMSKSCTDKLMLKQLTGLLAFPVDCLMEHTDEIFLKRMIVYGNRWSEQGYIRAFGAQGRLVNVLSAIEPKTSRNIRFFDTNTLPKEFTRFEFEKGTEGQKEQKGRASNISALWVAGARRTDSGDDGDVVEVLLNGVKQGFKQFDERERKGSVVCRRNMLREACKLGAQLSEAEPFLLSFPVVADGSPVRYSDMKARSCRSWKARLKQKVLRELGGWPQKSHEDEFIFSIPIAPKWLLLSASLHSYRCAFLCPCFSPVPHCVPLLGQNVTLA